MTTDIRRADLEADRDLIIESLAQWLTPESDARRFDWLYRDNPAGEAHVWIGADTDADAVVGIGSAFPRDMTLDGADIEAWVLGDFCVNPAYRSLGPALKLQRACLSVTESDAVAFCYDFPSQGMMAVYKRLRIEPLGEMVRLARPLRIDRKVREVVDVPGVSGALSAAGNLVLGLRDALSAAGRAVTTTLHEGPCDDEFTALADAVSPGLGLCMRRSADYLNWRFLAAPHDRYEILAARRDGALLGYAVFTCEADDATLVDLLGLDDADVVSSLVHGLARLLRKRGVGTLSAPMWEAHRWLPLMKQLGFWAREATPVLVHSSTELPDALGPERREWLLWAGDRDS